MLVAERKRRRKTQTKVARQLRRSQTWIARIERADREVSVPELIKISSAIGCNPVRLFRKVAAAA